MRTMASHEASLAMVMVIVADIVVAGRGAVHAGLQGICLQPAGCAVTSSGDRISACYESSLSKECVLSWT